MSLSDLREALREDVLVAAPMLLGFELVRGIRRARIVETEAYRAEDDPGCHAFRGQTPRNTPLFGPPGRSYVYFNYGVHWMLNVTAHVEGRAAGILIRAAEPNDGWSEFRAARPGVVDSELLRGPGKLGKAFGITNLDQCRDLFEDETLRLESGEPCGHIMIGPRVGLAPGKGHDLPWRFADGERLKWVSRPVNSLKSSLGPATNEGRTAL